MLAMDLESMPIEQKLELLDSVWSAIERDVGHTPSPQWHEDVLKERIENLHNVSYITLETLKKRSH